MKFKQMYNRYKNLPSTKRIAGPKEMLTLVALAGILYVGKGIFTGQWWGYTDSTKITNEKCITDKVKSYKIESELFQKNLYKKLSGKDGVIDFLEFNEFLDKGKFGNGIYYFDLRDFEK